MVTKCDSLKIFEERFFVKTNSGKNWKKMSWNFSQEIRFSQRLIPLRYCKSERWSMVCKVSVISPALHYSKLCLRKSLTPRYGSQYNTSSISETANILITIIRMHSICKTGYLISIKPFVPNALFLDPLKTWG